MYTKKKVYETNKKLRMKVYGYLCDRLSRNNQKTIFLIMKKNLLLTLGLLLGSTAATNAQKNVMLHDFESEQPGDQTAVGWYEFINSQDGDTRAIDEESGRKAMHFYNVPVDTTNWRRAIKFRNLPLKENTSYRVSFLLCGDNTYSVNGTDEIKSKARVALMQGQENGDIPLLTADSTQQVYDISYFQTPEQGYRKYTMMFFYANQAIQQEYYNNHKGEISELAQKFFLTMNIYSPGDYFIDDVTVDEASIAGVTFNYDVIRIDFGYPTNYKELLAAAGVNKLVYPEGTVKVELNGEAVNILSAELLSDGHLYVFLDDKYPESGEESVVVSFTNPSDAAYRLKYTGKINVDNGQAVLDFTGEAGSPDASITDIYSTVYDLPVLVSADPEDGSFNLPLTTNEFKFVFNKGVDVSRLKATLGAEPLTVSPSEGYPAEITLSSAASLTAGEYELNITDIYPQHILADEMKGSLKLTLNFGPVNSDPNDVPKVIMKDSIAETIAANNEGTIPMGWTVYNASNVVAQGTNPGSGPRSFKFGDGGDFTGGLYIRTAAANDGGCAIYGETENYYLTLEAGKKYQVHYNIAAWKATPYVKFEFLDPSGNAIVSRIDAAVPNLNGSKGAISGSKAIEFNYRATATGNYKMKWTPVANEAGDGGAWIEAIIGNVQVKYMPNAAGVEEMALLSTALANAKATLEGNAGERYAGPDFDALQAAIAKYDGQVFTAPSAYKNGAAELDAATKALKDHRALCDTYDPLVDKAKAARDLRTGTKFERHASYPAILASIGKYEGKVLTDNAELQAAITELENITATVTNIGRVVETLTSSMVSGLATLNKVAAAPEGITAAVNNALTDDAEVKTALKNEIKAAMYNKLADPANDMFAEKVDEATLETYVDSFDVSVFINNPEIYYTAYDDKKPADQTAAMPSTDNIPGWTMTHGDGWTGGFSFHYPWGGNSQYAYNPITCPAANGMIASWSFGYDIRQEITDLPAGTYRLYVGTGERGGNENPTSYIFANTTEKENKLVVPVIAGSLEPTSNAVIEDIVVTDGKLTIGMHMDNTDHTFLNNFCLIMKAPAAGFDYKAAAEDIANGIQGVAEKADTKVLSTELFDLNGRQVNAPAQGISIQKQRMADGSVKIQKVIIRK